MRRRIAFMALVALVSGLVLYLSYPRLIASVRYLPVDRALDRYYSDNLIPTDRLAVLIRFTKEIRLRAIAPSHVATPWCTILDQLPRLSQAKPMKHITTGTNGDPFDHDSLQEQTR